MFVSCSLSRPMFSLLCWAAVLHGCTSNSRDPSQGFEPEAGSARTPADSLAPVSDVRGDCGANVGFVPSHPAPDGGTADLSGAETGGAVTSSDGGVRTESGETNVDEHSPASGATGAPADELSTRDVGSGTRTSELDGSTGAPGVATEDDTTSDTSSASVTSGPGTASTGPLPVANYLPCDIEHLIASRCRVCHSRSGSGLEPLLETWSDVSVEADLVLQVVLEDYMPMLPPALSQEEKDSLEDWVASGAPPIRQASAPVCP